MTPTEIISAVYVCHRAGLNVGKTDLPYVLV